MVAPVWRDLQGLSEGMSSDNCGKTIPQLSDEIHQYLRDGGTDRLQLSNLVADLMISLNVRMHEMNTDEYDDTISRIFKLDLWKVLMTQHLSLLQREPITHLMNDIGFIMTQMKVFEHIPYERTIEELFNVCPA